MRTRERSLSDFSGISLSRVRGDSESIDRYPVRPHARFQHLRRRATSCEKPDAPGASRVDPRCGILGFLAKQIPGDGIIVKSKLEWINFGERLRTDELRYLAWLRKTLAAPRK